MTAMQGFHHVKLPVTDVARSRDWYARVLDFELTMEFVEEDVLMGVAMWGPGRTVPIALRCDPDRAKAMSGFDPIAIGIPSVADLEAWRDRLTESGEKHDGIIEGHAGSVLVGLHDPDGIEIRLYTMDGSS